MLPDLSIHNSSVRATIHVLIFGLYSSVVAIFIISRVKFSIAQFPSFLYGRFLGIVHIQRLLREPPHGSIGGILDKELEPLRVQSPLGHVTRMLATYNLVGVPVVDVVGRLLGAVTVDDVLDHILPDDWREERREVTHD